MKSKRHNISLEDLSAYLDGEAAPEEADYISKALSEDPELMETFVHYQRQMAELRRAHQSILDEDIPEHLLELLSRGNKSKMNG